MNQKNIRFAFFGTSHIAVYVLEELKTASLMPALIVSPPDKPRGRGLMPQPVAVSLWASENNVPLTHTWEAFEKGSWDVAIVVDYGKILPKRMLDIPRRGFLNLHPSLLPRLRGASPMRSAILSDEKRTGITIIQVDEEMDHGPIVAQKEIVLEWPPRLAQMEKTLLHAGGKLLADIVPEWVSESIDAHPQNDDLATYCEKFSKEDGFLNLKDDPYKNLLKIRAFESWPGTYAMFSRNGKPVRVKILDAYVGNGSLVIDRVVPSGKKEMPYEEFVRSGAKSV
ncbi:methionyl-tRNA formyltransferase [Candidatus Kaiserbacteria bacterium]|nr:methionyl-tRNA formyltransferase [Candidatus Kaiserbacteria bacterium]